MQRQSNFLINTQVAILSDEYLLVLTYKHIGYLQDCKKIVDSDNHPIVSIIIPTFNRALLILTCVQSALKQSYPHKEILIIDDGSTDETKEVLQPLISANQVRYYFQENAGPSSARNVGIKQARGSFISFLDSDDFFHKDKISREVQYFQDHPSISIVCSNVAYFTDELPQSLKFKDTSFTPPIFDRLIRGNFLPTPSLLFRRQVFDSGLHFYESRRFHEDWDLLLRVALKGFKFAHIPKVLCYCRTHQTNMTKSTIENARGQLEVIKALAEELSPIEKKRFNIETHIRHKTFPLIAELLYYDHTNEAKRELLNIHHRGRLPPTDLARYVFYLFLLLIPWRKILYARLYRNGIVKH